MSFSNGNQGALVRINGQLCLVTPQPVTSNSQLVGIRADPFAVAGVPHRTIRFAGGAPQVIQHSNQMGYAVAPQQGIQIGFGGGSRNHWVNTNVSPQGGVPFMFVRR